MLTTGAANLYNVMSKLVIRTVYCLYRFVTDDAAGRKARIVNSSDHKLRHDIEKTHRMSSTAIQQCMLSSTAEACYLTQAMLSVCCTRMDSTAEAEEGLTVSSSLAAL